MAATIIILISMLIITIIIITQNDSSDFANFLVLCQRIFETRGYVSFNKEEKERPCVLSVGKYFRNCSER